MLILIISLESMLNVIKNRSIFFMISWVLFLFSILSLSFLNLNLGIDMTWWTQIEFSYKWDIDFENVKNKVSEISNNINWDKKIINTSNTYKITWEEKFVIETWFNRNIEDKELEDYKMSFKNQITNTLKADWDITQSKYTNIWASFGDYIKDTAKLTLLIAIFWIAIYVAYAFSWAVSWISSLSFAAITVITLFHDVFISTGLYLLVSNFFSEFKVDTFFITALLTILWYSVNDTIVIFDRIRSNLKQFWWKGKELKDIINLSVNETLTRSIYTSLTLAFVLTTVFFFWPDTIKWFTLVMIFGTIVGTFSSVFIAAPILFQINKNKTLKVYKKNKIKPEDKIVV